MKINEFWKSWKNKTYFEKEAILSVEKAIDLVLKSVPKNQLVAIYIKGSFARREMNKYSDVDIVPIVTENKYAGSIWSTNVPEIHPVVVVPLSLWELKHNKLRSASSYNPDLRAKPDRLLSKLSECKLVYGKPLKASQFPIRSDAQALNDEIKIIKKGYILACQEGAINFSPLLKEVFWLIELDQKVKGKKVKHSFEGIAKSVKDNNHIVHTALKLRTLRPKDKKTRDAFIKKLKNYLKELTKLEVK